MISKQQSLVPHASERTTQLYTDHRVLEGWIHLAGCYRRKETGFHLFPQLAFVVIDRQMVNFRMDLGFGQDWENLQIRKCNSILG